MINWKFVWTERKWVSEDGRFEITRHHQTKLCHNVYQIIDHNNPYVQVCKNSKSIENLKVKAEEILPK